MPPKQREFTDDEIEQYDKATKYKHLYELFSEPDFLNTDLLFKDLEYGYIVLKKGAELPDAEEMMRAGLHQIIKLKHKGKYYDYEDGDWVPIDFGNYSPTNTPPKHWPQDYSSGCYSQRTDMDAIAAFYKRKSASPAAAAKRKSASPAAAAKRKSASPPKQREFTYEEIDQYEKATKYKFLYDLVSEPDFENTDLLFHDVEYVELKKDAKLPTASVMQWAGLKNGSVVKHKDKFYQQDEGESWLRINDDFDPRLFWAPEHFPKNHHISRNTGIDMDAVAAFYDHKSLAQRYAPTWKSASPAAAKRKSASPAAAKRKSASPAAAAKRKSASPAAAAKRKSASPAAAKRTKRKSASPAAAKRKSASPVWVMYIHDDGESASPAAKRARRSGKSGADCIYID